jgi:predicted molibdopterin-dependent oxidoreductase YjgC
MNRVLSVCPYCGTGCGLYLQVENNRVVSIEPSPDHPVSKGELCLKGYYGFEHLNDSRRLTSQIGRASCRESVYRHV